VEKGLAAAHAAKALRSMQWRGPKSGDYWWCVDMIPKHAGGTKLEF
jgi:hypothetical protein